MSTNTKKNKEFDCLLGGKIELPSNIGLLKFTVARCKEIQTMKKELKKENGTKLVFQKLPKHMRRRVMSHNAKRLPRRLRESHLHQMKKSGMPPKQKRPSRKYRRRPRNLLAEYARRRQGKHWLETHIWHAKRFHMIEKWGYKLPEKPCDKAFRACYRATAKHCLINDISFYGCIEITGNEQTISEGLKKICNPKNGLTPNAKAFITGEREGEFLMLEINTNQPIGNIFYNWKFNKETEKNTETRTIWLWSHPSYFNQALNNLLLTFKASKQQQRIESMEICQKEDNNKEIKTINKQENSMEVCEKEDNEMAINRQENNMEICENVDKEMLIKQQEISKDKEMLIRQQEISKDKEMTNKQQENSMEICEKVDKEMAIKQQEMCEKEDKEMAIKQQEICKNDDKEMAIKQQEICKKVDKEVKPIKQQEICKKQDNEMAIKQQEICRNKQQENSMEICEKEDNERTIKQQEICKKEDKEMAIKQQEICKKEIKPIKQQENVHTKKINEQENSNVEYFSEDNKIKIRDKRFELNRLRLTGPLSTAILHKILNTENINTRNKKIELMADYLESKQFNDQINIWNCIKNISSPAEIPPKLILSLVVNDPRFDLKLVKKKVVPDCADFDEDCLFDLPNYLSVGPIWEQKICDFVTQNKLSNAQICDMRSKLLVPGSSLPSSVKQEACPIPVMLIQRPGPNNDKLGYCSGWDIILPRGWTQPFWMSAIMAGAKPGGLRELDSIQFELSQTNILPPDSIAGKEEEKRLTELHTKHFFSLPPNKRPNYSKLAITSPFNFNWQLLLNEWTSKPETNNYSVLRDKTQLLKIKNVLCGKGRLEEEAEINCQDNCLVAVKLSLPNKGRPKKFAIICLPENKDFTNTKNKEDIEEPLHPDLNQAKRKEIRDAHQLLLKTAKRKRKKAKLNGKCIPRDEQMLEDYSKIMRELWLPTTNKIKNSCSRQVMGFITHGDFSFTQAQGTGVGYIALNSVKQLLSNKQQKQRNKVLVRNTTSRKYRFANLDIII